MTVLKPNELEQGRQPGPGSDLAVDLATPPAASQADATSKRPRPFLSAISRAAAAVATALIGLAVLVALWAVAAWRVPRLPSPSATFAQLGHLLSSPFYDHGPNDKGIGLQLWASLQRVFEGFILAAAVGIPMGLAMGASRFVWRAANPVVQLLRPVSPLAWFPIWLVVLRNAPRAAVWVIFMTALWPIVINTAAGAAAIPRDHRNVARVFRFGRWAYLRHVLLPDSLPSIVTGLRQSMGVAWVVIVAVEMLSVSSGIGAYVWQEYNALNLAKVISAIILIGGVGLILDLLFLRLGRAVAIEGTDS